ncbi:MAG: PAS domain S-box protein [Candidatus Hydrogenedentes bacterium]|nr:PAS domain S-box protein [Candidatus Hydrogenedentota bacterium]
MSLRTKVFLVLAPSVALITALLFFVLSRQMMFGYERIETDVINEHVSRTVDTFHRKAVIDLCRGDWAYWDDVYTFVADGNSEFLEANISAQGFVDLRIDTMIFVNKAGEVVLSRSYDPVTKEQIPVNDELLRELGPGSLLLQHTAPLQDSYVSGLLLTKDGAISIGSRPILTSQYEGPARGSLIFARTITQSQIDEIGQQLHLDCRAFAMSQAAPPEVEGAARVLVNSNHDSQHYVERRSEGRIAGFAMLHDIRGQEALLLEVSTSRSIYQQAKRARLDFALSFVGIGTLMLVGLVVVLELLIVTRLRKLRSRVREIRTDGDWSERINVRGGDEVSALAEDVNRLIAGLSESIRKEDEKDRRFRMLTTHAAVGMYEYGLDGKCLFVNDKWSEITGVSKDCAGDGGWQDTVHPQDRDAVLSRCAEQTLQGVPFSFECRLLQPSGDIRHAVVNVVPLTGADGVISSVIGSVMDLTEARRAEQEIRENEKRYREIIELQADLVCRYRPDTILTYVNDAYCLYFSKKRSELIGKSFLEVVPSSEPLENILLDLRNSSGPVATRHKSVFDSGEERWQEWVDTPVRDAEGHIVEFQAVGRDITERKAAEDALRESEAKLRSITSAVADAIIMMDEDGFVTFWNEAAERTFGYSRMEMLGRPLHDIIVPERYRAAFNDGHRHFLETGAGAVIGRTVEIQGVHKDGNEFPIELTIAPVRFSGTWHAIGTVRNITERKRAEEQLEDNARTLAAANEQLELAIAQANQLALEAQVASVAKSDFVANMSHEIRTPLNGVIGMTSLLLDTELTAEQRDFAETVRTSGEALLSVVNDILDFSKIEAGKMELEAIEFDLRAAVDQIGDILAPRAQEKGLQFTILIHHDVPDYVIGDPGRLRQILLNLAGNALKFTERGEIVVSAQLKANDGQHATVLFEVSDSGIGIPEDRLKLLFQPFTQADSSTTRKYGGTGLGLTISKRLCQAMGGEIGVRSTASEGSTFYFTVNFEQVHVPRVSVQLDTSALAGLRLLVVDESATGRKVYRELLRSFGVSVTEAHDTRSAYDMMRHAAAEAQPYAVVLVDHFEPHVNAAEFAQQVLGDPVLLRTRLLLVTSWPKRGDASEMAKNGYAAYLTKPVKRGHLVEAIAAVVAVTGERHATKAALVTQHTLTEAARSRSRILLVEDNIVNQKVATRVLEKLGYRCDIANNGREAFEAAQKTHYNLVLMDCQMPLMDGYEATKAIRQFEGDRRYTPIVALTASALRSDYDLCIAAGMDDVLTKPIHTEPLQKVLHVYLSENPPVRHKVKEDRIGMSAPQDTPVNLDRLSEITMGDPDLESELIVTFLADTSQRISEMAAVIASGDPTSLVHTAHAIKGAAGNMGAVALQEIAHKLELMAKSGGYDDVLPTYDSLKAEADRVKEYLSDYMHA